ncbi:TPA: tRNA (guanosine(37)-N1)-methyltransferase TrmD [Candidatus Falkowbacteria bacterium]|nr:tRNA (guanosine(37)-N1)-methyltransferase TrmD [Candidatus Falkowbacteria bacterium]
MNFHLLTIFPDILQSYTDKGMIRIAQEKKLIEIKYHDLRDFAVDKHGTVDDRPFGGGVGQVFMVEPIVKTLDKIINPSILAKLSQALSSTTLSRTFLTAGALAKAVVRNRDKHNRKIILLSAKGKKWTQSLAREYATLDEVVFICPRYEGVDERVKEFIDEEISLGDFVLTGGELGAAVIMDSITRLIPGVLGKEESFLDESHSTEGYLEYPQYTRPEVFTYEGKEYKVPDVLLSGHHAQIKDWRDQHSTK